MYGGSTLTVLSPVSYTHLNLQNLYFLPSFGHEISDKTMKDYKVDKASLSETFCWEAVSYTHLHKESCKEKQTEQSSILNVSQQIQR